ncbi:MAG: AbrB/MazE/SpoVT family DNA-binding domain-containing protein [Oscillospiraceae bacterium]|nr:AbrB/MazE/SpoVT family DNA-binding domain-containing protein [Oscillospiraceae bacterium]
MKATGIVRRIDDLGRVVIPKEIRRTMRIREGDPLEIYTDKDGEVIFKKYSPMGELGDFASQICDTLFKTSGHITAVCDRDTIIAVSGVPKRELCDKMIRPEVEHIMEDRQIYSAARSASRIYAAEGTEKYVVSIAAPIVTQGDVLGCVMFLCGAENSCSMGDTEYKLAQAVSGFLGRQMED